MQISELADQVRRLKFQIAIDGPAGSGKSTIGRGLAGAFACSYLDTGLMYRAVTLKALELGLGLDDESGLGALATRIHFELGTVVENSLLVDHRLAGAELHSPAVDRAVSQVSAHREVREELVACQRAFARDRAIVMVGRDIGTVVLPTAPVKLWLTASASERGRRRGREQGTVGVAVADVTDGLHARDLIDSSRSVSPLRRAKDAVEIDTDQQDEAQSLDAALDVVEDAIGRLTRK